jgi:hypothetical protein
MLKKNNDVMDDVGQGYLTMDKAIFSLNYLNSINNLKGLLRQGFAVLNLLLQ